MNKLHYYYWIGILIGIIIILLTFNFAGNKELLNYLNFALTTTSLFLALIAILYSFFSNSSISNILTQIGTAASEVSKTSKSLELTGIEVSKVSKSLESTANDVSLVSKSLELTNEDFLNKLDALPILIKNVEQKIDLSSSAIEQLKKTPSDKIAGEESAYTPLSNDQVSRLLNSTSLAAEA